MGTNARCPIHVALVLAAFLGFANVAFAQVSPPGTTTTINNGAGDQTDAHISGNLVSYTSNASGSNRIRFYNFSTGADLEVPNNGEDDFLSDISGTRIVFTRVSVTSAIYVYDTASSAAPAEVASSPTASRRNPAIGNATVAWQDFSFRPSALEPEIVTHNLATGTTVRLTNDAMLDRNPAVSADGSVIVWAKCNTSGTGCDIWQATQVAGVWTTMPLTGPEGEESTPDTTGQVVVYASTRAGETDIYWKPVGGGTEQRLNLAGVQRNPRISGTLISFESQNPSSGTFDVFVFDISTSTLYRITDTPANEILSDIWVGPTGQARVVYSSDATGDFNVYAFTFQLAAVSPADRLAELIALVGSLVSHDGLANSLTVKLQHALAKLGSGDVAVACNMLNAFINETQAQSGSQSGKKLTPAQGSDLISAANEIRGALGCP